MGEPNKKPLTEKDMLSATVKATAGMIKKNAAVKRIEKQMADDEKRELAQSSASTIGETTPESET